MAKKKQFLVLGLGRFGQSIVKTLINNGQEVLACDIDKEKVQDAANYATHVLQLDLHDETSIDSVGIGNFDVVIICMSNSVEATALAILTAKERGVAQVIVKANSIKQKAIFERIGADRVVLPEKEMGERIATNLISSNVIDLINLSEEYAIAEIQPQTSWVGLSIIKAGIRRVNGLNIVAIKRQEKLMVTLNAEEIIKADDILVVIGNTANIRKLTNKKR